MIQLRVSGFAPWLLGAAGLGWLVAPGAAAQQLLTLEQAITLGLRDNRALQLSGYDSAVAQLGVGVEEAAFRFIASPVARAEAGKDGTSSLVGIGASQLLRSGQQFSGTLGVTHVSGTDEDAQVGVVVQVEQPLFRHSGSLVAEAALDAARQRDRRARRADALRRSALALEIVRKFTGLLEQRGKVASGRQALERVDRFMRLVEARESVGKLTRVDTLRAELQLGRVRAELQNDIAALQGSEQALAQLLGKPLDTQFELVRPQVPEYSDVDVPTVLAAAERNRVELAQAQDDEVAALRGLAMAERGVLPDLRLSLGYRDLALLDSTEPFGQKGPFIGVSAGLNLDRARAEGRIEQERLRLQQSVQGIALQREDIQREVADAVRELGAARAGRQLSERNVAFAQRQLDLAQRLFELGRESALTVSQAQDELLQAQQAGLAADSRAIVAAYALARAAGTLLESPERAVPLARVAPR